MRTFHLIAALSVWVLGLCGSNTAFAEWSEIAKDEDVAYYFDKDAVMPVHVSRYAWTLVDFPKGEKTSNGESYKSVMTRWRMFCKTDMVVRLSVSYFEKPMGKGKEVAAEDAPEFRLREAPIRPNTYLAALKKEICSAKPAA
ncbi:hypothetical protein B9Z39_05150 [Limnohabitans sp. JirII-29]|uniref:surface-adhesin E family protein n=1 Tax=Limnohabitans sp. JirII-29 TaxID=1835756 RepID=UPI000D3BC583|nr:surface-adhesin E family protein [Limnohabitans sp. JirII-29]PUE28159.1 hypothetical protein B9Z39_05150 [Limnohabitans sp. JirII-29]